MNKSIFLVIAVLLSGCGGAPLAQNPEEYKASFDEIDGEGTSASRTSEVISMGVSEATKRLETRLVPCLNGSDTPKEGLATAADDSWMTRMHKINSMHSQMTVQTRKSVKSDGAQDGAYLAVVDLNHLAQDKTKVDYYYSNSVKHDVIDQAGELFRGKEPDCKFK